VFGIGHNNSVSARALFAVLLAILLLLCVLLLALLVLTFPPPFEPAPGHCLVLWVCVCVLFVYVMCVCVCVCVCCYGEVFMKKTCVYAVISLQHALGLHHRTCCV